jgi:hypothetical protein
MAGFGKYQTQIWRGQRIRLRDGRLVIRDVWGIDKRGKDGFCWGWAGIGGGRVMVKLREGNGEWKEVGKEEWVRDAKEI